MPASLPHLPIPCLAWDRESISPIRPISPIVPAAGTACSVSRQSGRMPLLRALQIPQPLLNVDVDALIAPRQVAGVELLDADFFEIVGADGVGEDGEQELDPEF